MTARITRDPAVMEWQPIETAPKDGTWFIGGWWFQKRWVYRLGRWNPYYKGFYEMPGAHKGYFEMWKPLPDPPASIDKTEDAP